MPLKRARLRISDYNENRKRKLNKHERRVQMVSLSLTSMVDMFAILVIFLLANSGTMQDWVQVSHKIQLPTATTSDIPEKAATLQIAETEIFGNEVSLLPTSQVLRDLTPLKRWLATLEKKDGYINVVGHESLPYGLIKRIVGACQDAGFTRVNLAVQPMMNQK